ncbi:MAG: SH3 domain-containing protein [Synergistaceae bacterium]|nr:SH3 domain-containing protein [Synergistota bacterium]NLM72168.1 SH3 domain-containing protein [Synergistaceae bacterium]
MQKSSRHVLAFFVFLAVLTATAGALFCSDSPTREELIEKPAAGTVAGKDVNVRDRPSTKGKALGRLGEEGYWEELVVIDAADGEDGETWYRVLSEKLGEGWIHGRFVGFEGLDDPIWRLTMAIRRDFGTSPEMTERLLGKPLSKESEAFRPEDWPWPEDVTSVELRYQGGSVVFWIIRGVPFLVEADFEEGVSFGPISFGDDSDRVESLLGQPHDVWNRVWTYHTGMRRVLVGFGMIEGGEPVVDRLIFERDPY